MNSSEQYNNNSCNTNNSTHNAPPVKPIYINKGNNGCLMAVIFVLGFFAVMIIGGILLFESGTKAIISIMEQASTTINSQSKNEYFEEILQPGDKNNRVALIPLNGVINGWGNEDIGDGTVYELSTMLTMAEADESIKAVILLVNSPGGGMSASDILHHKLLQFKETGKKVVVYIDSLCASGGYYISAPADYIIASPTALIGSIGVIMEHIEVTGLLEKIGVVVDPIKSSESKDIGSPFKKMTKEEREYFDSLLDKYYSRFVDIVAEGRNLPRKQVIKIANGKVYLAAESLAYGLIDKVDYFQASITEAAKATTVDYPEIITYQKEMSFENLLQMHGKTLFPESLDEFIGATEGTRPKLLFNGSIQQNNKD